MIIRHFIIVIISTTCITSLAFYALSLGIDGAVLSTALTLVAGLGGYSVGRFRKQANSKTESLPQPHSEKVD